MLKMLPSVSLLVFLPLAQATADIRVSYTDSSPTDVFVITNVSGCALYKGEVTIDFTTSKGGLVFDIMRNGWAGNAYQPLRVVSGEEFVKVLPDVKDGDQTMTLEFHNFAHGSRITLNVDVDDTKGVWHPSVEGGEIEGASINVITPAIESNGMFDNRSVAETDRTTCMS